MQSINAPTAERPVCTIDLTHGCLTEEDIVARWGSATEQIPLFTKLCQIGYQV